jgi:hypothetical protein
VIADVRLAAFVSTLAAESLASLSRLSIAPLLDASSPYRSTVLSSYTMSDKAERATKFPLQGLTDDGWSNEDEATATCACGAVQMVIVCPSAYWLQPSVSLCERTYRADK